MKVAFLLLAIFFLSFSFRSEARELTVQERLLHSRWIKTKDIQTYMVEKINVGVLSFPDYLSYQIFKKACYPLTLGWKRIEEQSDEFEDQTKELLPLYQACSEGVLGLSHLYIGQQGQ